MHVKDFEGWNQVKKLVDGQEHLPSFNEREIWWCRIGINVGHEEDGKGRDFNRPVLIVKKFSKRLFWGLPATTRFKNDPHYFAMKFKGSKQCLMLTHLRLYDAKRIHSVIMGTMPESQFEQVKKALGALL